MGAAMGDSKEVVGPTSEWTTGLFDCSDDLDNCCVTSWYACIPYGQMVEILDSGNTSCRWNGVLYSAASLVCLCCVLSGPLRKKLRARYNLPEGHGDFCTHFWCEYCALCQEFREMQNRGLDPALGWAHYAEQAAGTTSAAKPAEQIMTKEI
jgi:Cys-rich protein (TIGR01571 family)